MISLYASTRGWDAEFADFDRTMNYAHFSSKHLYGSTHRATVLGLLTVAVRRDAKAAQRCQGGREKGRA
jgi:hypothetical protein